MDGKHKDGISKRTSPWKLVRSGTGPSSGQLFQHKSDPNRWNVKVFVGRNASGKKQYASKVVYGSKKAANAMRLEMLHKKSKRQLTQRSTLTFSELVERWLVQKRATVSPRTLAGYEQLLERHVLPTLGRKLVSELELDDFGMLYARMREGTHVKPNPEKETKPVTLSSRTVRLTHTAVNQSLKHAVKTNLITQNPVTAIELPVNKSKERQSLGAEDRINFILACEESAYGAFYRMLIDTGLRPGEACALKWDDIDFHNGSVKVTKAVTRGDDGEPVIAQPKTLRSTRSVPIMKPLVDALKQHKARQERLGHASLGLVFTNERGELLRPWTFNKRDLRRTAKAASITFPVTLYSLRHTFATLHLGTGTPVKQVSAWMGHSTISQTADTYMHASYDIGQQWMERHEAGLEAGSRTDRTSGTPPN